MNDSEIQVLPDSGALTHEAARRLISIAAQAQSARGRFALALAGGSTPAALYRLLGHEPYRDQVDWSRTLLFFGDERCVPPDDPASNFRMVRETLLAGVPVPAGNVLRMRGELPGEQAAEEYARRLWETVGKAESDVAGIDAAEMRADPGGTNVPRLDLVLLGMGEDGHTASLFPGMPALAEARRLVVWTPVPGYVKPAVSRVTLTLPVLNAADHVLFLVVGEAKAPSVRAIFGDGNRSDPLPAARVRPVGGTLTWLLDQAAATGLTAS